MDFVKAKEFIINKLTSELNPSLLYHSVSHTLDVTNSVKQLGQMEKVNEHDMLLLQTAALFHDSGMLIQYEDHEDASTILTKKHLPKFEYSEKEIELINKMILTTKLPQTAHSQLEKILCDADLDYLGRDDFFMIAQRLQYEWNQLNIHKTTLREWYELQLHFLIEHSYFTPSAKTLRDAKKKENINEVKELLRKQP